MTPNRPAFKPQDLSGPTCAPSLSTVSRRQLLSAGVGAVAALHLSPSWAQASFATKPITLLVPFTAGGASDIGARLLAPEMSKLLGQSVVVENLAGAGGAIAMQKLIRSPADGHTLLYGGMSEALLIPMINPAVNYKVDDLMPVALAGASPVVFVVRPDFPANSVDELITMARKNPGRLSFGSAGIGSFAHVMTEVVKERAGVFMVHIPYRGGAQILTDVIGGQLDLAVTTVTNAAPMVAAKRVKVLGVSSKDRVALIKEVPTFSESTALKGLEMQVWAMIFTPKGTPEPIANQLSTAINTALELPAMKAMRTKLGADLPYLLNPTQARAFLQAEQKMYLPVTRQIKPE